jgi:hypothetical protein
MQNKYKLYLQKAHYIFIYYLLIIGQEGHRHQSVGCLFLAYFLIGSDPLHGKDVSSSVLVFPHQKKNRNEQIITKFHSRVGSTPASYLGGPGFKSRPEDQLS